MGNECCADTRKKLGFNSEERKASRMLIKKKIDDENDHSHRFSNARLTALWNVYDTDKNGTLEASELKMLVIDIFTIVLKELDTYQEMIDEKNDGANAEIKKLKHLQKKFGAALQDIKYTATGLFTFFTTWDENHDGTIEFSEFQDHMNEWLEIVAPEKEVVRRLSRVDEEEEDSLSFKKNIDDAKQKETQDLNDEEKEGE